MSALMCKFCVDGTGSCTSFYNPPSTDTENTTRAVLASSLSPYLGHDGACVMPENNLVPTAAPHFL